MPRDLTHALIPTPISTLTIIVTDLHLPGDSLPVSDSVDAPPLESLELFLARAGASERGEWRRWLATAAGAGDAELPVAAVSRYADFPPDAGLPQAGQWWLANPVHFEAALDHVRLSQLLTMTSEEWAELTAAFNAAFPADSMRFAGASGRNAYLYATQAIDALTVDPARVLGSDVHGSMPSGPGGTALKRLMTEVQMWLHEHPLNSRRKERGLLPVNGLWIWGGGSLPKGCAFAATGLLYADDAFATGLWRLAGASARPLPRHLEAAASDRPDAASSVASPVVMAVTLRQLAGDSDRERMTTLEQSWIAPALSLLRDGAVRELRLHVNDQLFTATRTDLWRFWRGRRPWLEAMSRPMQHRPSPDR